MKYYISDLHLFHKNVTGEGNNSDNRPFDTLEEMHKYIKEKWNRKITNGDTVYILGDVVKKIELMLDYYKNEMPKHIHIIISHIENMETYGELKKIKEKKVEDIDKVKNYYNKFLDEYFSDNNQTDMLRELLDGLKSTFVNS